MTTHLVSVLSLFKKGSGLVDEQCVAEPFRTCCTSTSQFCSAACLCQSALTGLLGLRKVASMKSLWSPYRFSGDHVAG